jgi:diguanylate cyclase (GGDEF)-like protein
MFLSTSPWLLWTAGCVVLLVAISASFLAGVAFAPAWHAWRIRRACRSLRRLYEVTFGQLESSERLCRQLGSFNGEALAPEQWSRLEDLSRQLQDAFHTITEKHRPGQLPDTPGTASAEFTVEWKRGTSDATQIPDRAALDENLQLMLTAAETSHRPSGVLLVGFDKGDQLRQRFGADVISALEARLSTVLIKSARDQDLVCRAGPDAYAVLLPSVSPMAGARVAEKMRTAVREHRFHIGETGPEVVVTASFGYAACLPGDAASLVLDRAGAALTKSQSCGRNQLHVHDAYHSTLCRVG